MQGKELEHWRTICRLVETEQNPEVFLEIVQEIQTLLTEQAHRLITDSLKPKVN